MNTVRNWWAGYCRAAYRNYPFKRQHYIAVYLFVLALSALLVYTVAADTHPIIHHQVVALTHDRWIKRVKTACVGMALVNLIFIFQFVSLCRYGPEAEPPVV